jgi:hypothetical protein
MEQPGCMVISHFYKPPLEDLFTQAIAVALGAVGEGAVDVPARPTPFVGNESAGASLS